MCKSFFQLNGTGSVVSHVGPNETGMVHIHGVLQGVFYPGYCVAPLRAREVPLRLSSVS